MWRISFKETETPNENHHMLKEEGCQAKARRVRVCWLSAGSCSVRGTRHSWSDKKHEATLKALTTCQQAIADLITNKSGNMPLGLDIEPPNEARLEPPSHALAAFP